MKFSHLALGIGLLLPRLVTWAEATTLPPDPLQDCVSFHLGFEEGLVADRANGNEKPRSIGIQREGDKDTQPISNDEVMEQYLADGLVGKGLTNRDFKTRFWLPFSSENNLNPVHATILWWLKIAKPHPTAGGGMLFLQGGWYVPIQCTMDAKRRTQYDVTIYTHANCTEWGRRTNLTASFDRKEGVWTQVGLSWDKQSIYFIVNGKRVAAGMLKDPFTAHPFGPDFILGLFGWSAETDVAVMDEVTIYDRLLAPDELVMEYQRFMPPTDGTTVKIAAPSPGLRMESFFYPGVSRLRCEVGYEGFRQADEVKEARILVKGPDDREVGRWAVTRFEDQMASEIVDLPKPLVPGKYQVEASLCDAHGKLLSGPLRDTFEKKTFPFENNTIGISDQVLYPWTAMKCRGSGGRSQVDVWNREYRLTDTGFFKQVKSGAWELLSRPVYLEARSDGKVLKWKGHGVKFGKKADSAVDFTAASECEKIRAQVAVHIEFDGMFQYTLTLAPNGDGQVDGVDLVVPLKEECAWLLHACSDGARGNSSLFTPRGEGRVWDSTKVRQWHLTGTFIPYLWLGDDRSGLCWWADSEKGWVRPAKKEDPAIEVRRVKGEVQMVFHLIGRSFQLKEPRTIVFAFNASPVRPRPEWARGWSNSTLAQDGFLSGPHLMVHGSCGWVSSNQESAPDRPYAFTSLRPISDAADEWLRGFARKVHDSKQQLVVYTYLRGRAVDRGDEVKYYANEWERKGVPPSAEETQQWKSYHGNGTGANMTRSRIDYDLWCMKHDADLGVDGFYFDEIFGSGQCNPAAGWGFKDEPQ